jgi:lambda family phage portal protein
MKFKWPWNRSKTTNMGQKRAYQGAAFNRLVHGWMASNSSMDAEIKASLPALRNRSRDLGRNNDYVRQFFRDVQLNVVGQGIPFEAQVLKERGGDLNETINDKIELLWERWTRKEFCHVAGELSFQEIERLIVREVAESGEFYVRKIRQSFGGSKIPLALELIEADRVDDNYNGIANNGNEIVMGVEKDKWGRRTAYYIKEKHPGDNSTVRTDGTSRSAIRVPADEIIPLFISERAPQTRGVPWLCSSIMRLHHMQGYEEAEVISARANAMVFGFIEGPEGEVRGDGVEKGDTVTDLETGVVKKLGPGEKMNIPNMNRPNSGLAPFMSFMLRGVAAGAGGSYESISKDYSQSNYSSSRLSLLSERDNWRTLQAWLIRNFHQPIFEEFLDLAVLSGAIDLKNYELFPEKYHHCIKWMPRGWAWVDPAKEVSAYKEAIRGGMKTLTNIYAEEGKDFDESMRQRQREIKTANDLGLVFDTDASVNKYMGSNTNSGSDQNNS